MLRPAAHVLEHLQGRGITHRGIRLDNVFQSAPGQPVVLGAAWAAPPAMAQPALFEPPYSAMCLPAGRGDGSIADDVYALGVLLLCLALGACAAGGAGRHGTSAPQAGARDLRRAGRRRAPAADHRRSGARHAGGGPRASADTDAAARSGERAWASGCRAAAAAGAAADHPGGRRGLGCPVAGLRAWRSSPSRRERGAERCRRAMAAARAGRRHARGTVRRAGAPSESGHVAGRRRGRSGAGDARDRPARSAGAAVLARGVRCGRMESARRWRPRRTAIRISTLRLEEIITREEAGNWAALRPDRCDFAVLRVEARQQHGWLQQRGEGRGAAADLSAQSADALRQPADGRTLGGAAGGPAAGAGGDGGAGRSPAAPSRSMRMSPPSSRLGWNGGWTRS